jgi:hypothetical protein
MDNFTSGDFPDSDSAVVATTDKSISMCSYGTNGVDVTAELPHKVRVGLLRVGLIDR